MDENEVKNITNVNFFGSLYKEKGEIIHYV